MPAPWLTSDAALAIGPIQKVCAPTWGEWGRVILALVGIALLPLITLTLSLLCCAFLSPRETSLEGLAGRLGVGWLPVVLIFAFLGFTHLRQRLLLGERGIAHWRPYLTRVVLWEQLGSEWRCLPSREAGPLTLTLEHRNGARIVISDFFAEHHHVALRVLEEIARRGPEPKQERSPDASDKIKPAQRDIAE